MAEPTEATSEATTGALIGRAGEQLSTLVRTEMELARAELKDTVDHAVRGASFFGAAGVLALYAGGVLITTVILALALVLDAWLAALIVGVVLAAAAGVAALVGKKQVDQATPAAPAVKDNVKRDLETVQRKGRS